MNGETRMNAEIVKRYLNRRIKLVRNNFPLYGVITEINDDCIIFKSKTTESAISLDVIEEIIPLDGGDF